MKRWIAHPWLWVLPALSFLAAPAGAQSITCFGSIIITSLGTEGMTIQVPDGATVSTTAASEPAFTPDGKGGGTSTITGPASIDIQPPAGMPTKDPTPTERSPSGQQGSAGTGQSDPAVTEVPSSPVSTNPVEGTGSTVPAEVPAPTVDGPIMTGTVEVPAPPPEVVNTAGPAVKDTPEPASLTLLAVGGVGTLVLRRQRRTK
ncbi:MAG: PEP-CTERM sorting domain-containing protein [Gemmataceae bacterium]